MFDRDQIVQEYILGFSSPDNMDLLLNDSVILLHRLYSRDTEIISFLNQFNNNTFEEDTPILSDVTYILELYQYAILVLSYISEIEAKKTAEA